MTSQRETPAAVSRGLGADPGPPGRCRERVRGHSPERLRVNPGKKLEREAFEAAMPGSGVPNDIIADGERQPRDYFDLEQPPDQPG
jgi:hypothetical protein